MIKKWFNDFNNIKFLLINISAFFALIGIIYSFTTTLVSNSNKEVGQIIVLFFDKFLFLTIQTNIFLVIFTIIFNVKKFKNKTFLNQRYLEITLISFLILIFVIYYFEGLPIVKDISKLSTLTWFFQGCLHFFGLLFFSIYFGMNWKEYFELDIVKILLIKLIYLLSWLILVLSIAYIKYYALEKTGWFNKPWQYIPYEIIDPIQNSWFGISRFITIPLFSLIAIFFIGLIPTILIIINKNKNTKKVRDNKKNEKNI